VIDLVANDTMDLGIVGCLKDKFDLNSQIVDGRVRAWLTASSRGNSV
jgi:hypothetical protein